MISPKNSKKDLFLTKNTRFLTKKGSLKNPLLFIKYPKITPKRGPKPLKMSKRAFFSQKHEKHENSRALASSGIFIAKKVIKKVIF
jgi:hypothetical protein